jgi:hypothetical protein
MTNAIVQEAKKNNKHLTFNKLGNPRKNNDGFNGEKSGYSLIQLTICIFIQHLNPFIVSFKDKELYFY